MVCSYDYSKKDPVFKTYFLAENSFFFSGKYGNGYGRSVYAGLDLTRRVPFFIKYAVVM